VPGPDPEKVRIPVGAGAGAGAAGVGVAGGGGTGVGVDSGGIGVSVGTGVSAGVSVGDGLVVSPGAGVSKLEAARNEKPLGDGCGWPAAATGRARPHPVTSSAAVATSKRELNFTMYSIPPNGSVQTLGRQDVGDPAEGLSLG
jgi:hypothetical protein